MYTFVITLLIIMRYFLSENNELIPEFGLPFNWPSDLPYSYKRKEGKNRIEIKLMSDQHLSRAYWYFKRDRTLNLIVNKSNYKSDKFIIKLIKALEYELKLRKLSIEYEKRL